MFDLGWTELLIIGVVALIVVGPKDLPKMFRTLGQFTAKARNMAREFQRAMDSAADEAGVKDIARDLRDTASGRNIKDAMGFDELDKEMRSMGRPDQWGKSPSQKPAKPGPKAKPDPAAAPGLRPGAAHSLAGGGVALRRAGVHRRLPGHVLRQPALRASLDAHHLRCRGARSADPS